MSNKYLLIINNIRKELAMNDAEKLTYFNKLIEPYEKRREKKFFIDQYLRGAGNELKEHFWSEKSSSRMAFDLYTWMKDDKSVVDIEYEFLLPGLGSGGMRPNMDIFIETEDELIFIESKFTEKANLHYIDNGHLSPAYYAPTHGKKNMILATRFHGYEFADKFSKFCYEFEEIMKEKGWHKGSDWFEPKQETCHLLGVLFYIFDKRNQNRLKGKKIRLFNIFWEMYGDIVQSDLAKEFKTRANTLISEILDNGKPNGIVDFKFGTFTIQEMFQDKTRLSKHIVFPEDIKETIYQRNDSMVKGKKR